MSRKLTKEELLEEFQYDKRAKEVKDIVDLEWKMKQYARENDIELKGYGKKWQTNNTVSGADYTQELIKKNKNLGKVYGNAFRENSRDNDRDSGDSGNRNGRNGGNDWEDKGYWDGMASFYGDKFKNRTRNGRGSRSGGGYRERKSLKQFLFSPLGVVLLVIALCVFLYRVVGPAAYSFIMNGPFFKILLIILAGAAVVAVLRSARGWPSGVKFVVLLVIGLVLLYMLVGPAIYSFLMSGALFRIICLIIAIAASVGIWKGNLGWPIGIKLVVIIVIWVVLKNQVL